MKEVTRRIMSGLICVTMLVEASLMTSCNSASAEGSSESSTLVFEVADSTVDTGELSNTPETYVNPIAGTELAKYCTDNFVILDNSFGVANVYEIEVVIPLHLTREWNNEHVRMESSMSFMESQNWSYEYDLFWVQRWFFGMPFNTFLRAEDYEDTPYPKDVDLITYKPPEDTLSNTIASMHVTTIGNIQNWVELPFRTAMGKNILNNRVLVFDLDGSTFPREASLAPGEPPYFPEEYDTLHYISLADRYIDNIPVYGTMYNISMPDGVYDYEDLLTTAKGSNLVTTSTGHYQCGDTVVQMVRTGDFTIKSIVKSNLPIKPVSECMDGIKEAVEYFYLPPTYRTIDQMKFYCAELTYLPLSNYDLSTYDYTDERTFLIPGWQLYFEVGQYYPYYCITVDATTGKCLYSKEYSTVDQRLEKPDPEMKG